MTPIIASFLIPWLIGFAIVDFLFPVKDDRPHFYIRLSLALGLGFGLCSSILFLCLLVFGGFHWAFKIIEIVICLISVATLFFQKIGFFSNTKAITRLKTESNKQIEKMLGLGFSLLFFFGLLIMIWVSLYYPHGNWDAWAIWNNRARFIFRAGNNWMESFSPLLDWSHPDYPLLIPLSIARCWFYFGAEKIWVPAAIALLFSVSTTALLASALTVVQNKSQGYLGGIILLGTPFFLLHSASQYADVPLAFFFLSVVVIFYLYDQNPQKCRELLVLGGLLSGFSAWTKNEGLLFVIILLLVRFVITVPKLGWKEYGKSLSFIMAGLLPILCLIGYFKRYLAPPNDLISIFRIDRLFLNLTDLGRYFLVIKTFLVSMLNFGHWPLTIIPILIVYFFWAGRSFPHPQKPNPFIILILQLFGYFLTFLFTPHDLKWHMDTSLDRLLLQLWPGLLFAGFTIIRTPEETLKKFSTASSFRKNHVHFQRIKDFLRSRLANRKSLFFVIFLLFSIIGIVLVRSSSGVSSITWMFIYQVDDFKTLGEIFSFIKNLKIPIPIAIALAEIAEYKIIGSTILCTQVLYRTAMILVFILSLYLSASSKLRLTASFCISIVFLWTTVVVHPSNPQIYDIYYPLFILSYILLLKMNSMAHSQTMSSIFSLSSGFALSMAELSRPFVFIILPVLIIGAYQTLKTPRNFLWFLLPIILFSGSWHAHLALSHGQLTWTNHSGFNLSRSWTMVELPVLVKEDHNAPIKPDRWPNLNTVEHYENNRRIQNAILLYIFSHPQESIRHFIRKLESLLIDVKTGFYTFQPYSRIFLLYKPAVWIAGSWSLINLIFLCFGFLKYHLKILSIPENVLIIIIFFSLGVFAAGEAEEEARFLISVLPMMAAFPRYFPSSLVNNTNSGNPGKYWFTSKWR